MNSEPRNLSLAELAARLGVVRAARAASPLGRYTAGQVVARGELAQRQAEAVDGDRSDADIAADQVAALLVGRQIAMSDGQPMTITASRRGGPWLILRDDETEMRVKVKVVFAAGGGIGCLHDEDPPTTGQLTYTPTGSTS